MKSTLWTVLYLLLCISLQPGQAEDTCSSGAFTGLALGCFQDSELLGVCDVRVKAVLSYGGMTVNKCIEYCAKLDFSFAGLFNGDECWCSKEFTDSNIKLDDGCEIPCSGDANKKCGGSDALSVYKVVAMVTANCESQSTDVCDKTGKSCSVLCPSGCASASRTVWGTTYYTGDSSLCKAAVHDGRITNAAGGVVHVAFRAGDSSYTGSTKNGITTTNYGSWPVTFWFTDGVTDDSLVPTPEPSTIDCNSVGYSVCPSGTCRVKCPSGCLQATRTVWGTNNVFTDDSSVCKAAIHQGVITADGGLVSLTLKAGEASYQGATKHGVTTSSYGVWRATMYFS
ncbi:cysteine-rich secretory protein LCCL domain-containing 2-like [Glandiceps talaboti]